MATLRIERFFAPTGAKETASGIEVPAILFESGPVPDRDLSFTDADLDGIADQFARRGGQVPLKIEHTDTIFDPLGWVKRVYRQGQQLFGKLTFTPGAWALVKERESKGVSVALEGSPWHLTEVSLVKYPAIANAALLYSQGRTRMETLTFEAQQAKAQFSAEDQKLVRTLCRKWGISETQYYQAAARLQAEAEAWRKQLLGGL